MIKLKPYENYPLWVVALSNAVSLSIYALGFIIMFRLGWLIALVYLLYILGFEYRLLSTHCTACFYWGKTCGFGRGRLSAWFFKKRPAAKFWQKAMTWQDLIPDLLISSIPFITGIVLIIIRFNIIILSALILLFILSTQVTGFIRSSLTCKYCKQKALGCPADKLFKNK